MKRIWVTYYSEALFKNKAKELKIKQQVQSGVSAECNKDIINIDNDDFLEESKQNNADYDYDDFEFEETKGDNLKHQHKTNKESEEQGRNLSFENKGLISQKNKNEAKDLTKSQQNKVTDNTKEHPYRSYNLIGYDNLVKEDSNDLPVAINKTYDAQDYFLNSDTESNMPIQSKKKLDEITTPETAVDKVNIEELRDSKVDFFGHHVKINLNESFFKNEKSKDDANSEINDDDP